MGKYVATCGCFDIVHGAHINLLKACRSIGDVVVVFLNTDESVKRIKGEGHPRQCFDDRAKVLNALQYVDAIVPFSDDTPAQAIKSYVKTTVGTTGTFIWVKGADTRITGLPQEEKDTIRECDGIILYFDNPSNVHSSDIAKHIATTYKEEHSEDMV